MGLRLWGLGLGGGWVVNYGRMEKRKQLLWDWGLSYPHPFLWSLRPPVKKSRTWGLGFRVPDLATDFRRRHLILTVSQRHLQRTENPTPKYWYACMVASRKPPSYPNVDPKILYSLFWEPQKGPLNFGKPETLNPTYNPCTTPRFPLKVPLMLGKP